MRFKGTKLIDLKRIQAQSISKYKDLKIKRKIYG